MQRQNFNSDRKQFGNLANRCGAILAMTGLLLLSACGSSKDVTQNNLAEPSLDSVAPTLTTVTIKMARDSNPKPDGTAQMGQSVRVDIVASEGLLKPVVTISGVAANVIGSVTNWYAVREMTDSDVDGEVTFEIEYQDVSGELGGAPVNTTTDGSAVMYCAEGCPDTGGGSLAGDWRLDGEGAASVGPAAGSSGPRRAMARTRVGRGPGKMGGEREFRPCRSGS